MSAATPCVCVCIYIAGNFVCLSCFVMHCSSFCFAFSHQKWSLTPGMCLPADHALSGDTVMPQHNVHLVLLNRLKSQTVDILAGPRYQHNSLAASCIIVHVYTARTDVDLVTLHVVVAVRLTIIAARIITHARIHDRLLLPRCIECRAVKSGESCPSVCLSVCQTRAL